MNDFQTADAPAEVVTVEKTEQELPATRPENAEESAAPGESGAAPVSPTEVVNNAATTSAPSGDATSAGENAGPTTPVTAADVEEAMRDVVDPELGINIVDLGLLYGVTVDANNHAVLDMTLTSAACPLTDVIEDQTAAAMAPITSGHTINWVWMPPWGPDKITDEGREMLRALGFNL